jgi:serine/threonine protein kinase
MRPEQWDAVKTLLNILLDLPRADRENYLQAHCTDMVVRAELGSLLAEYERDEFDDFPLVSRFVPRRKLGSGAFGVVFEAYDSEQQLVLALKVLKQDDPASLERFKKEFWTLRELDHPNLVTLYQLFQDRKCWFFTMQLVRGKAFLEYLNAPEKSGSEETSTVDIDRLRSTLLHVCRGVQALHRSGKIHRDLKPDNILVSQAGTVTLIDLGMARDLAAVPVQQSVAIVGSSHYLSPEQGCGGLLSEATDWYSVGVILFEALTGKYPFDGEMMDIIEQKRSRAAPEPISLTPGTPEDLNALCRDLLQRDPAIRPSGPEVLRRLGDVPKDPGASVLASAPPIFVGREEALQTLTELFGVTQESQACVLANISGRSGIGKSALIRQFQKRAVEKWPSTLLLAGRCHESAQVRFKVLDFLIDRLTAHLRTLTLQEAKALLPPDIFSLVRLFPTLQQTKAIASMRLGGSATLDSQELRDRAFEALIELLGRLAKTVPVLLCIDDVQWADKDSAVFFRYLVSHVSPPNVLILVSGRSEDLEASPFLQHYRNTLPTGRPPGNRVEEVSFNIGELSTAEALKLAQQSLSNRQLLESETAAVIANESSGIPFLIVEFVRYAAVCADQGMQPRFTIHDIMRQRMAALPAAARTLLSIVAAAGQPVPETVACKAAKLDADDFPGLQSLTADSLVRVRETPEGRELEIYHDRYREAVLHFLEPEARRQAHLALAMALSEHVTPDPASIATQFRMAGKDDSAGEQYLLAAGRAAAAYAFDQASEFYRLGRELRSYPLQKELELARLHGEALVQAGRGNEAAEVFQHAALKAQGLEQLDFQRRAAEQLLRSGDLNDGLQLVRAVARTLGIRIGDRRWQTLLSLMFRRAIIALLGARFRLRSPKEISRKDLAILDTYWSLAVGLSLVDMVRASDFSARHLLKAIRAGDPQRLAQSFALTAGHANIQSNRRRYAELALVRAKELAQNHGHQQVLAVVESMGAVCGYLEGEWRDAYACGVRAEKRLREECSGVRWEIVSVCIFSLKCLILMGHWKTYAERLPPLLEEARMKGDRYALTGLQLLTHSYMLDLLQDDPSRARCGIRGALEQWSQKGFHLQDFFGFYGETETDLYEGRIGQALDVIERTWPVLRRSLLLKGQVIRILALHLQARVLVAASAAARPQNPETAALLLRRALAAARAIARENTVWGHALSQLIKASCLLGEADYDGCARVLSAAETAFAGADMLQYRAAAQWRRGQLCGGPNAAGLVRTAEEWLLSQGVRIPCKMVELLAPGDWANTSPLQQPAAPGSSLPARDSCTTVPER